MKRGTRLLRPTLMVMLALAAYNVSRGEQIAFPTDHAAPGTFPQKWISGWPSARDDPNPPVQVHWYNEHTVMMRENKSYNNQAIFMYLFFGNDRAVLLDQGSTALRNLWPLRDVIDGVVAEWCKKHGRDDIELVLINSHLHGDHYSAWNQFVDRPNTILCGLTHEERMAFFGITHYPEQRVEYDLGGRKLLIWGSPGHEESEIAIYDAYTQLLCTGDMFYRGRLGIRDYKKWFASMERLVKFADEFPISHIINMHNEMTLTPKVEYPNIVPYQPEEPPMDMDPSLLRKTLEFAKTLPDKPGRYYMDELVIVREVGGAYTAETNPYEY